jgi:hypothetical protein
VGRRLIAALSVAAALVVAAGTAACGDDEPAIEAPATTAGTIPY